MAGGLYILFHMIGLPVTFCFLMFFDGRPWPDDNLLFEVGGNALAAGFWPIYWLVWGGNSSAFQQAMVFVSGAQVALLFFALVIDPLVFRGGDGWRKRAARSRDRGENPFDQVPFAPDTIAAMQRAKDSPTKANEAACARLVGRDYKAWIAAGRPPLPAGWRPRNSRDT